MSDYRNRGHTRTYATEQAALALGITPRRAKKLLYGEAFNVLEEEARRIKAREMAHFADEARHLAARLEAIKARLAQSELEL